MEKERREVEKLQRYQELLLPDALNFYMISGLSKELQNKLTFYAPKTIAQAQLIPGMTPAALSILIFQSRRKGDKIRNTIDNVVQSC